MTTPVNPGPGESAPVPSASGEGPAGGPPPGPGESAPVAPSSSGGFGAALASFFQAILRPLRALGGGGKSS